MLYSEIIKAENKYSYVEKMIIIAHGNSDRIHFDPRDIENGYYSCKDISSTHIECDINILDIQACNCGNMFFNNSLNRRTCVAYEFASRTMINRVYAWCGKSAYSPSENFTYSLLGSYRMFSCENGTVTFINLISGDGCLWHFSPLEYLPQV